MPTQFGELAKLSSMDRKVLNFYDRFLLEEHDPELIAEKLQYILTKNPPRVRTDSWSASSAGTCLRQQQFTFLGMPQRQFTPDAKNIFSNGDYVHLRYQVAGLIQGWLTDAEVPMAYGRRVLGTMDGDLTWGEVLEIKSINDRGFKEVCDFGPRFKHKRQATAYMLCTGYTTTRFIYENKNDNKNVEFEYQLDNETVESVKEEWETLDKLSDEHKLAPMLQQCKNAKGFEWRYCQFNNICPGASWPTSRLELD